MSRVGKKPVAIPPGVEVKVDGKSVTVKGPKGTLQRDFVGEITVSVDEAGRQVVVSRASDDRRVKALHGLSRALVNNMVEGVIKGYEKIIEIIGVGYRAEMQGSKLRLSLGYANPVEVSVPRGVTVEARKPTRPGVDAEVVVTGIDKETVGQVAANIRKTRPPDLYHGKGVRYRGEYVRRLAGKTFGSGTGGS